MTDPIVQPASDRQSGCVVDDDDDALPVDPLGGEIRLTAEDLALCPDVEEELQRLLAGAAEDRLVAQWWADPLAAQAEWDAALAELSAQLAAADRQVAERKAAAEREAAVTRRSALDGEPGVGSLVAAVETLDGAPAWTAPQAATVGFVDEFQDAAVSGFAAVHRLQNHLLWLQLRCAETVLRAWTGRTPSLPRKTRSGRTVMDDPDGLVDDAVATELALAAGITHGRAAALVDAATALVIDARLPLTAQVAAQGRLDWARLRLIVSRTRDLPVDAAQAVEALVFANPKALQGGVGRFETALTAAILAVDADAEAKRRARHRSGRRVSIQTGADGAAWFTATGPGEAVTAAYNGLDAAARYLRAHGDPRTLDQLRHDLFVTGCTSGYLPVPADLLPVPAGCAPTSGTTGTGTGSATSTSTAAGAGTGTGPHADDTDEDSLPAWFTSTWPNVQVNVNVTVSAETLMGLTDAPGALRGYGPIPADAIRDLVKNGVFRCVVVDGEHGTVLGVGKNTFSPGYVAGERLKLLVEHASPTCTAPHCDKASWRCDLDHRTPYAHGGATCDCNMHPICRVHHRLKTAGLLVLQPSITPDDPAGTMVWVTRTGRAYSALPHAPLPPAPPRAATATTATTATTAAVADDPPPF